MQGSKMIRYRCSLHRKRFRQEIGWRFFMICSASKGNLKFLEYRGSMIARLKLKSIDGKAPPGVDSAA